MENGFAPDASTVTVCGVEGPHNVNDHYGRTGEEILLSVAGTLASTGANNFYLEGEPVVVLGPEHAEVVAAAGFSKADVKRFLSEHAIVPRSVVSEAMIDVLEERIPDHLLGPRGRDGVRFVTRPDDLIVVVAGGAGRHSRDPPDLRPRDPARHGRDHRPGRYAVPGPRAGAAGNVRESRPRGSARDVPAPGGKRE